MVTAAQKNNQKLKSVVHS